MDKKGIRIKCPRCLNYMIVIESGKGELKGHCKRCNSIIILRQSVKGQLIRIVKSNN